MGLAVLNDVFRVQNKVDEFLEGKFILCSSGIVRQPMLNSCLRDFVGLTEFCVIEEIQK
jgi:hypothetical protein